LNVYCTMMMHPPFLMKKSEGQVSTRNERACREIKGNRTEFHTKPFLLNLVFPFIFRGDHTTLPLD